MNLLEEVTENKFLLIVLTEEQYMKQLYGIVKSVEKTKSRVCYVCLSRPYKDVVDDLKKNGINTNAFVFIDVLSSHYGEPAPRKNCIFLDSPDNLDALKRAIERAVEKENCRVLLFDTISALLMYEETFPIIKFTHNLTADEKRENVKKVFLVLKKGDVPEKENMSLINDLRMFADKTVNFR